MGAIKKFNLEPERENLKRMVELGGTVADLASHYGIGRSTMAMELKKMGIDARQGRRSPKKRGIDYISLAKERMKQDGDDKALEAFTYMFASAYKYWD